MKGKRLMALLLVLALTATPAQAAEASYSDTTGHYAAGVIQTWSGYGVLKGYEDGTFRPDGTITRAELAAVLNRIMGYQDAAENTFTDLPADRWYTDGLLRLAEQGIFHGGEDGKMNPEAPITRQETFAAMARALTLEESGEPTGFKDDDSIADWAKGYVSAMKQAGYIQGDQQGNIRANAPITRAEVVTILDKMAAGFVNTDGTYSEDCKGNLFVNAKDVRLKDMTVDGDLIVTDGVGDGDVYLDKVTVKGDIILRGCGENSFHIMPGCKVEKIIVTKTTTGAIRLVNESGQPIPMVWVNDGTSGVVLDGDALGDVVIACDAPVTIASKKVKTVSVTKDAKVTVEKGTTVSKLEVAKTAKNAAVTVSGRVSKLTNDAKITVNKQGGSVGGSSSGSSSSGGGSYTPPDPSPSPAPSESPEPVEITEVTLELLAPSFAAIPDEADVLGTGYTAETKWFNADGSAPSYRWKADSAEEDTFTADTAYKAVITLSPMSDRTFADNLKVNVTDGKIPATEFTPAKLEKSGNDWVVTMSYEKTAVKEYVESVGVSGSTELLIGETGTLSASYTDNRLIDPATYTYKWYQCDDTNKTKQREIAATKEYTIPADDMTAAVDNDKELYYFVEVTAGGKTYSSGVTAVRVDEPLDISKIEKPEFRNELSLSDEKWYYGGAGFRIYLDNVIKHRALHYNLKITYIGTLETTDGTVSPIGVPDGWTSHGSGSIYSNSVYRTEDGAYGVEDIDHWMEQFYLNQLNPNPEYVDPDRKEIRTVSITGIKVTAEPEVYYAYEDSRNQTFENLKAEKTYDISAQPIKYHLVRTAEDIAKLGEKAKYGSPLPGKYQYTISLEPEENSDNWYNIGFELKRQEQSQDPDSEEVWVSDLTDYTDEMKEAFEKYETKGAIGHHYSILGDFFMRVINEDGKEDTVSRSIRASWGAKYETPEQEGWYGGGNTPYASGTVIGADTYLIYRPAAEYDDPGFYEYYYYKMDNTDAVFLHENS